jgi:hypothetical protein
MNDAIICSDTCPRASSSVRMRLSSNHHGSPGEFFLKQGQVGHAVGFQFEGQGSFDLLLLLMVGGVVAGGEALSRAAGTGRRS